LLIDLQSILSYVEQLDAIDTDNVAPCNQVLEGICNVMRDDLVGETLSREQFLANAPDKAGGYVRVPPILKSP
jgi:aspartyl-tRNA(Asn)/glutamyl-tRNA(Gln) amidotransferase subunit C